MSAYSAAMADITMDELLDMPLRELLGRADPAHPITLRVELESGEQLSLVLVSGEDSVKLNGLMELHFSKDKAERN